MLVGMRADGVKRSRETCVCASERISVHEVSGMNGVVGVVGVAVRDLVRELVELG